MPIFEVSADHAGERLDSFLTQALAGCSRRAVKEAIATAQVIVNGRPARKGWSVRTGDVIEVADDLLAPPALAPSLALRLKVLFEDDHVVALDKPAGIPSLALDAGETRTVANFLLARWPEMADIGRSPLEPGIVHRLDTGTSGILLAARSRQAYESLRRQFQRHTIEKEYVALVSGRIAAPGVIRGWIAADRRDRRKVRVVAQESKEARPAETSFRPLESHRDRSLLAVQTKTGVRHQVRVHLASIGHPLVGDELYGGPEVRGVRHHLLHACYIAFDHPARHERIEIRSAPPAYSRRRAKPQRRFGPK